MCSNENAQVGPRARLPAAALIAAGAAMWLVGLLGGSPATAWRGVLVAFLFLTSVAAGMLVWSAIVVVCKGRWAKNLEPLAAAGVAFAVPSLVVLGVLWASSRVWAPWRAGDAGGHPLWMNGSFLFGRDMLALGGFWVLGGVYCARRRAGRGARLAPWLLVAYAAVLSLLAFDLVMPLTPGWYSTLFGGYFFISAAYAGIAAWTLAAVAWRSPSREQLADMGKLLLAFSMITTYLLFAHLLVIWYENLPHEVLFIIPRFLLSRWGWVSVGLLCTIYLGPLVLLLTSWAKRTPAYLASVCVLLLTGLSVERWWLVEPAFRQRPAFAPSQLGAGVALLGVFLMGLAAVSRRNPESFPDEPETE